MHYTAKNSKITLNGREFLVTDFNLGMAANLNPVYLAEQRHSFYYSAQNGIGGTLSFNYLFTGNDYLKTLLNDETTPISGQIAGMSFNSGYLRSYGFNAQPNSPIPVKSEIVFFDDLDGFFVPTYEKARNIKPLLMSDAEYIDLINGRAGSISGVTSFNYQFNSNVEPIYKAGDLTPYRITFKEKEIVASLEVEGITGILPTSGMDSALRLRLISPVDGILDTFFISGKLSQRELGATNKDFLKSNITIRQNYIYNPPSVTSFIVPATTIGSTIIYNGNNLGEIILIMIGGVSASFSSSGNGSGSFIIPDGAVSGAPIIFSTFEGTFTASGNFPVIAKPIGVSGVTPITGYEGNTVRISGSNFYNISEILFGTGTSNILSPSFSVITPNTIQATIPYDARWDYISVVSKTGGVSGRSPYKFVPIPIISGVIPNSGMSGDFVGITGSCFTSVVSGTFNNIISPSLTVNSNSGIRILVPSGNIFGYIKLYGVSGVIATSPDRFYPIVKVTGIIPNTGVTGEAFQILGQNFYNELLYNTDAGSSHFLASVGGATGQFYRVNPGKLTGIISSAASSGFVYLYDTAQNQYPSTAFFTLRYGQPFISGIFPKSGKVNDVIQIQGTNLFESSGVNLSGKVNNVTITGSGVINSILGDTTSFYAPNIIEGHYNVILTTSHGKASGISGTNQGFYLMMDPIVSGFFPISGGIGNLILLSGRNLYPQTKIYFNNSGIQANMSGGVNFNYTQLQFLVPIGASGTNTIFVYNGVSSTTGSGLFTLIRAPFISGFFRLSGEWGDLITVSGSYIGQTTGLYVGSGRVNSFTNVNNSQLTFNIPTGMVSDYIYSYSPGGIGQSPLRLATLAPRVLISGFNITGIRPNRILLITGNYLSGANEIWFSGQNKPVTGFTKVDNTGIYVTVPENTVSGFVTLVGSRGLSVSSQILNIIPDPRIFNFPTYGAFGQLINISGADLTGMRFYFTSANSGLWSGLVDADNQVLVSSTGASFTVPRNISIGPIAMSGDNEIFFGSTGLFIPLPTISGTFPTGAMTGSLIIVTGYNATQINRLLFVTGYGNVTYVVGQLTGDHSKITGSGILNPTTGHSIWSGMINSNFGGFGNVFLISEALTGIVDGETFRSGEINQYINTIKSPNQFYFNQIAPVITGFNPIRGNTNTVVSVSGVNFRTVTGIYIKDSLGTILQTITGNIDIIKFKPGVGTSSGQITGVSLFGAAISNNYFTYIAIPDISGFSPRQGIMSNTVRLTGTDFQFVTGVFFGDFLASFTTGLEGTNYVVTGIVPDVTYSLPRNLIISLWNEAGFGQAGYFTMYQSGAIIKYRTPNNDLVPIPSTNGQIQFAHGLNGLPHDASIVLVNRTAEHGYSVDDEVNLTETTTQTVAGGEPFSISKDATNITLSHQFGTYPLIEIMNKTASALITGGVSTGSWRLRGTAWKQLDS